MIKVIDNFIPLEEQLAIEQDLIGQGTTFPWFFKPDVTFKDGEQKRPSMAHAFFHKGMPISPFTSTVQYLGKLGAEMYGYKSNKIYIAKTILQHPLSLEFIKDRTPDEEHIDIDREHLVVLYYVNDSDGDTIIGDTRVSPKRGRAVLFDGSLYHTAEQPRYNMRCIININVV
jgi:hypothetical protein